MLPAQDVHAGIERISADRGSGANHIAGRRIPRRNVAGSAQSPGRERRYASTSDFCAVTPLYSSYLTSLFHCRLAPGWFVYAHGLAIAWKEMTNVSKIVFRADTGADGAGATGLYGLKPGSNNSSRHGLRRGFE
jgi:hypothetical protein